MTAKQIQPPGVFAHHRAAVTTHYAVMPPEGILESRIPGIENTTINIQTSPALGARFAQILLTMRAGGGMTAARNDGTQSFFYVTRGKAAIEIDGKTHDLSAGGYAYIPANTALRLYNARAEDTRVVWIRKPYEALAGTAPPSAFVSHESQVSKIDRNTRGRTWQHLLPDAENPAFDFAVNILCFEPGCYFPMVETHVMEHGLYMLRGQGMYLLQHDWHECWADDFIYMAPYCPQFFYATGWSEAAYLLYKNVNRDVSF